MHREAELLMYTYPGLHVLAKLAVVLSLLWANPGSGHTAAWIGVQRGTDKWAQVGVEESAGDSQPYLYVEWKPSPRVDPKLLVAPWGFGEPVRVVLQHRGHAMWRAGVPAPAGGPNGLWTSWVYIRYWWRCRTMELFEDAHGAARIDGRYVSG